MKFKNPRLAISNTCFILFLCCVVIVYCCDDVCGGWWSIVGLCWRQYVAMAVDQFVKIQKFCATGFRLTKFCATGSRRTKFCATAFLSHKKIWLHYLKFCATGSCRTKFYATDAVAQKNHITQNLGYFLEVIITAK